MSEYHLITIEDHNGSKHTRVIKGSILDLVKDEIRGFRTSSLAVLFSQPISKSEYEEFNRLVAEDEEAWNREYDEIQTQIAEEYRERERRREEERLQREAKMKEKLDQMYLEQEQEILSHPLFPKEKHSFFRKITHPFTFK